MTPFGLFRTFLISCLSLAAISSRTSAQCGDWWEEFGGANAFWGYSLAYDTQRQKAVMFGGGNRSQVWLDETWEFDGEAWSWLNVPGPSRRALASMIYDSHRGQIILFGGADHSIYYDDTWSFDGLEWRRLPVTGPSARMNAGFVYDEDRNEAILFGGQRDSDFFDDCWRWTGEAWEPISVPRPSARGGHSMVFDQARHVVVLFGGSRLPTYFSDTWEWDGTSWAERPVAGPGPRTSAAMVYAAAYGRSLLFAGRDPQAVPPISYDYKDVWSWDGTDWVQLAGLPHPDYFGPTRANACYEPELGTILMGPGYRQGFIQERTERHTAMLPPGVLKQPDPVSLCAEGDASFSVRAVGFLSLQYQWARAGTPLADGPTASGSVITGSTTPDLAIAGARAADEGSYTCTISSLCGPTTTQAASLRICRADLQCDGAIDFLDYLAFLNLYEASDPRADFNEDGVVDFFDYLEFLNFYDAGC